MAVCPQSANGIDDRPPTAHRTDHPRRTLQHKPMQHIGRQVVEQMHIVDDHQHRRTIGGGGDRTDDLAHQPQRITLRVAGPRRERPQRNRPSRLPSGHPPHRPAPAAATANASRANRDLPTPALPASITPRCSPESASTPAITASSSSRPTNGQLCAMVGSNAAALLAAQTRPAGARSIGRRNHRDPRR